MKEITAYKLVNYGQIRNGSLSREWMDFTNQRFAYGCLPLIIANQMGWDILCESSFSAIWDGSDGNNAISIKFENEENPDNKQVGSHFGYGVLTFHPGFLFKTESGHNLYVKGIPNLVKDAIQALEGVVETDWLPFTFTMNWKFTRPDTWVEFTKGEPIARIMPLPRNYIEGFLPIIKNIQANTELFERYKNWKNERLESMKAAFDNFRNKKFGNAGEAKENDAVRNLGHDKNYLKGIDKDSKRIEFHQKRILIKDFNDNDLSE